MKQQEELTPLDDEDSDSDTLNPVSVDNEKPRSDLKRLESKRSEVESKLNSADASLGESEAAWAEFEALLAFLQREVLDKRTRLDFISARKKALDEDVLKRDLEKVQVRSHMHLIHPKYIILMIFFLSVGTPRLPVFVGRPLVPPAPWRPLRRHRPLRPV